MNGEFVFYPYLQDGIASIDLKSVDAYLHGFTSSTMFTSYKHKNEAYRITIVTYNIKEFEDYATCPVESTLCLLEHQMHIQMSSVQFEIKAGWKDGTV